MSAKKKILAVLVNYGDEQISYLERVVNELTTFEKYETTIIVNSNIPLDLPSVEKVNVITLDNYQYLPLTCRKVIWDNKDNYDIFIYGENDHLFKEHHVDKHIEYSKLLPKDRITGLIQYEEDPQGNKYYPGYHADFEWDYTSVERHGDKVFAHFSNVHQATFIITQDELKSVGEVFNFNELVKVKRPNTLVRLVNKLKKALNLPYYRVKEYSVKCKVNTDVYEYANMKKLICISEFDDNLIHHLPNLYIEGNLGRTKQRSEDDKICLLYTSDAADE